MSIEAVEADVLDGGFVAGIPPHQVGLAETPDGENFNPSETFGAKLRGGSSQFGVNGPTTRSGNSIYTWIHPWTFPLGTAYYMVHAGTSWYSVDSGSWLEVGTSTVAGPLSGTLLASHFIATRGSIGRPYISSTGITMATMADANCPASTAISETHASKVWLAASNGTTVYFSVTNDPNNWTTVNDAGNITISDDTGDRIQALKSSRSGLYVFMQTKLFLITGTSPADFEVQYVASIGTFATNVGVISDGTGVFFAAVDGIYYATGTNCHRMSDAIRDEWNNIAVGAKFYVSLAIKNDQLWIFCADTGSFNERALVLAFRRKMDDGGVRGVWTAYPSQAFSHARIDPTINTLFALTCASTPQIYKLDTASSAGAVEMKWNTPDLDFGHPTAVKTLERFYVHVRPDGASRTVSCQWYGDGVALGSVYGFNVPSTGSHYVFQAEGRSVATVKGKYLRLEMKHTGALTIYGYRAYAEVHESEDMARR